MSLVGMYPFLGATAAAIVYPMAAGTALIAVIVGIVVLRPAAPAPWVWLASAFALYVCGDLTYTAHAAVTGQDAPFPWFSDIAYLSFYPALVVALGLFLLRRGQRDRAAWLDAMVWTLGGTILIWKPLIEPYLVDDSTALLAHLVGVAYPLLDMLLLLMVVRLTVDPSNRHPAGLLLVAGLLLQTLADVVYSVQTAQGVYVAGQVLDAGWMLASAAVGAAALQPSMTRLTERVTAPLGVPTRLRLLALLAPAVLAPALLIVQLLTGDPTGRDALVACVALCALFALGAARASGVIRLAERHSRALAANQVQLELALLDRDTFTAALEQALRENDDVNRQLKRRADHDTLTGLLSRDHFVEVLNAALTAARSGGLHPSVAFLDLDDFKVINDTLGHEAGDVLLVEVARRMTAAMGPGRHLARFGGDEFAVLVFADVEAAADRLLDALRLPVVLMGQEIRIEVSVGVTTAHDLRSSASDLLREADLAMYAAKASGGGWTRYESTMASAVLQRLTLRARLVQGLTDAEVEAWFQPVVDLRSGALVGFEALARWCRPGHPPLPPDAWLPWAEESGLIVEVDRAVLHAAVAQLARWRRDLELVRLDLAVNISGRSLQSPGIEHEVLDALTAHGVPCDRLVLEVTEGVLIDDHRIGPRLQRLRDAGVRIALDDFGTGWSSLSNLQRLPVDQLKLDRSFTAELGRGRASEAVPAAIMQLAHALSLDVVAEGVETPGQREQLIRLGFDRSQGFLFGHAQPARDLEALVSGRRVPAQPTRMLAVRTAPLSIVR